MATGNLSNTFLQTKRWFALRTRPKCEKRVQLWLADKGIKADPALVSVHKQWSDRVKRVAEPLFPGYVFVHIAPCDFVEALNNPWAVDILHGSKGPVPLRPDEMAAVRRMAEGASESGARPFDVDYFSIGEAVVVTSGPFEGIEGTLVEDRGHTHVVIRIDTLRMAKGLSVSRDLLKRVLAT
jgi:transcription antitermination factor NusG